MELSQITTWILLGLPAFIIAGSVHEYMHAWTAKKLGDYTATIEGRLSLNPLVHLDPIGFLFMIFFKFGWMKPVPVNEYNFKKPVRDMALTAAAGPFSNLVMAIIGSAVLWFISISGISMATGFMSFISGFFSTFVWVNIALMIFNLFPIPPLDGYRIVRLFIPSSGRYYWEQLERYAFIFLALIFLPFSPLSAITGQILITGVTTIFNLLVP